MTDKRSKDTSLSDREIEGLFRLLGEQSNPDTPVTDEEAEILFRLGEGMQPSADEARRRADGLLERLRTEAVPAVQEPGVGSTPAPEPRPVRPRLYDNCRELKLDAQEVAECVRVNEEVLIQLDSGKAKSIPRTLIRGLASVLHTTGEHVLNCFAPPAGDVRPMAAHGRRGAGRHRQEAIDFLSIIESSSLPDADKQYWRRIVADEEGGNSLE